MKGFISREFTVWCGFCGGWRQESANRKDIATKIFRSLGWRMKKAHGWVCPDCLQRKDDPNEKIQV